MFLLGGQLGWNRDTLDSGSRVPSLAKTRLKFSGNGTLAQPEIRV